MRKAHLAFSGLLLFLIIHVNAQVGIGTTTPDPAAMLEVSSTSKGVLIPRVSLTGTEDAATVSGIPVSMIVYNTATAGSGTTAVIPGYYYWNGTHWLNLVTYKLQQNINTNGKFLSGDGTNTGIFLYPNGSMVASGLEGGGPDLTGIGQGAKFVWYPKKASLRVGSIEDAGWDGSYMGSNSVAFGHETIAGGESSVAMGILSSSNGTASFAAGGSDAFGNFSVAVGGATANGHYSFASGRATYAGGYNSTAMGYFTQASGDYSTAMGHSTQANGLHATSFGHSTGAGGNNSFASGNSTSANGDNSFAAGNGSSASGISSTAIGKSTVALGLTSTAFGNETRAEGSVSTAFGDNSAAIGQSSTAMGAMTSAVGDFSTAMGYATQANGEYATAMGVFTFASGTSALATGFDTRANATNSTAMGSSVSVNALHGGSFIIGDNSGGPTESTMPNEMSMRFANGYKLYTNDAATVGVKVNPGDNAWSIISDVNLKENFVPIDAEDFLSRIGTIPLTTWNYKGQNPQIHRHYGPMAQDFHRAFGTDKIGTIGNNTSINQADFDGVNFTAIQALESRTRKLQNEKQQQDEKINNLEKEIETLKKTVSQLLESKKN